MLGYYYNGLETVHVLVLDCQHGQENKVIVYKRKLTGEYDKPTCTN